MSENSAKWQGVKDQLRKRTAVLEKILAGVEIDRRDLFTGVRLPHEISWLRYLLTHRDHNLSRDDESFNEFRQSKELERNAIWECLGVDPDTVVNSYVPLLIQNRILADIEFLSSGARLYPCPDRGWSIRDSEKGELSLYEINSLLQLSEDQVRISGPSLENRLISYASRMFREGISTKLEEIGPRESAEYSIAFTPIHFTFVDFARNKLRVSMGLDVC